MQSLRNRAMGCRDRGTRTPSLLGRKGGPSEGPSVGQSELGVCGARARARARAATDAPSWAPALPADAVSRGPGTGQIASQFPGWRPEPGAARGCPGHWALFLDVSCPSRILEGTAKTKCAKTGAWGNATLTQVTNRDRKKVGEPHAMKRRTDQADGPKTHAANASSGQVHSR